MSARCFGLIANGSKPRARELVEDLAREFEQHGIAAKFETRTAALAGKESSGTAVELAVCCELLVVLGGDGTILQVLHELGDARCPIFGINLGSLGFLTSSSSADWQKAAACVIAGDYVLTERTVLTVELIRDGEVLTTRHALNDAVISRGELSRLIKLVVSIDGKCLTEYNADGLIVATPTGSTAYSLSAGGPVLTPDSGVFVVTPICPHVLTMRPVIVSDESRIEITPAPGERDVFVTLDGQQSEPVRAGDILRITKAPHRLALAMLPGMSFFEVLRQKLKWSGSAV